MRPEKVRQEVTISLQIFPLFSSANHNGSSDERQNDEKLNQSEVNPAQIHSLLPTVFPSLTFLLDPDRVATAMCCTPSNSATTLLFST
jgi:hypothetical protein